MPSRRDELAAAITWIATIFRFMAHRQRVTLVIVCLC